MIQPPQVAEAVLRCVEKGKREVTVPWFPYRPISILQALAPGPHRPVREHVGLQARLRLIVARSVDRPSLRRAIHSAKSGSTIA